MRTFTQAVDFLNFVTAFGQQARVQIFLAPAMGAPTLGREPG